MACESMPLASGYLKAFALADERIASEVEIEIYSFDGADSTLHMVKRLFSESVPDMVGFSVLGWNFNRFGAIAESFKQFNPDGWVVFGGNHVTNQAKRTFGMFPAVDVVVNGEGELTFREVLEAFLAGRSPRDLPEIKGISYQRESPRRSLVGGPGSGDQVVSFATNTPRERIQDLSIIPSPVLSGAIPISDSNGAFRYDVGIMETNRGCPYKCAFCYWGGSIGQKVRTFPMDRLREEIALYGKMNVYNIALCDANFGMLKQDIEFVDCLIETREKYGYPRNFDSSWAKNKGKVFREIVRKMQRSGFTSSFTLALQTLDDPTLEMMGRKNMKVNDWEELSSWLKSEGLECYAELIWGCPGQTYDSFIEGYDKLARNVNRIATYPHLLMPNTDYTKSRKKFGFITHRGENDDFEYVIAHNTMDLQTNRKMHRFLFWARVFGEYMVFRNIWTPLLRLLDITQSQVLLSLDAWIDKQESNSLISGLKACRAVVVDHLDASRVTRGIHFCYVEDNLWQVFKRWWAEEIVPKAPEHLQEFFADLFRYEWFTRPVYDGHMSDRSQARKGRARADVVESLETEEINGEVFFVRRGISLNYDVPGILQAMRQEVPEKVDIRESKIELVLYLKAGFSKFIDNHEFYPQYVGRTRSEVEARVNTGRISALSRVDSSALSNG